MWKQRHDFGAGFTVDHQTLLASTRATAEAHRDKAAKMFAALARPKPKHDRYQAQKQLMHALRFVDFGIQLARHGAIVDYGVGADWRAELLAVESDEWAVYAELFEARYRVRVEQLARLCDREAGRS